MSHKRVCLVTDELYPFTAGGIGRLLHNLIRDSHARRAPVEFHLLVPSYAPLEPAKVQAYFGHGVRLHVAQPRPTWEPSYDEDGVYPPAGAFTDSAWHAESMDLMLHLKRLAREGCHFDVIEFGDYKGWAYCTLQEKYLGRAFARTEVAVRLHSTMGIIAQYEPYLQDRELLGALRARAQGAARRRAGDCPHPGHRRGQPALLRLPGVLAGEGRPGVPSRGGALPAARHGDGRGGA